MTNRGVIGGGILTNRGRNFDQNKRSRGVDYLPFSPYNNIEVNFMDMTYQLNPLVNAQKNFNVMETRLFYLGLQDINPHLTDKDNFFDEEFPDTIITPAQLKEIFGHGQYLREVKKACRKLISTSIEINYEDGFDLFTVFQHLKYKEKKGLHIKFNEDMRPFILDIYKGFKKYGFTKIEMQQIFVLESAYAMRILELMLQYNGKKKRGIIKRKIEIEELRKRLSVPVDSYKKMKDFRKNVLDLPISEIEKKTKYTITYETIKEGRKIVAIEFSCNCNAVQADDGYTETIEAEEISMEEKLEQEAGQLKLIESKPTPAVRGLTDEEQDSFDRLVMHGVDGRKAAKVAKTYDFKRIKRNIDKAVQQKSTAKNLPGLIISFIENDIAGEEQIYKKEAQERQEKKQQERRQAYDDFHGTKMAEIGKGKKKSEDKAEKTKPLEELTELEAEMVIKGKANSLIKKRMGKLGLTTEDVKKGKRK